MITKIMKTQRIHNGMIKYCANKLEGEIDLTRFSQALGVSENFVQITLEILENIDSVKIRHDIRR